MMGGHLVGAAGMDVLYDGTKAAALYSQLCGVLAGFSFLAATTILAIRASGGLKNVDRRSIGYLLMAFVTLLVGSYLWALNAADAHFYPRTAFEETGGSVALGLGALQMVCAVTALMADLEIAARRTLRYVLVFVTIMIAFSFGNTLQQDLAEARYRGWIIVAIPYLALAAEPALMILLDAGARARIGRHLPRRNRATEETSEGLPSSVLDLTGEASLRQETQKTYFSMRHASLMGVAACLVLGTAQMFVFPASSGNWIVPQDVPGGWRLFELVSAMVVFTLATVTLAGLNASQRELNGEQAEEATTAKTSEEATVTEPNGKGPALTAQPHPV